MSKLVIGNKPPALRFDLKKMLAKGIYNFYYEFCAGEIALVILLFILIPCLIALAGILTSIIVYGVNSHVPPFSILMFRGIIGLPVMSLTVVFLIKLFKGILKWAEDNC